MSLSIFLPAQTARRVALTGAACFLAFSQLSAAVWVSPAQTNTVWLNEGVTIDSAGGRPRRDAVGLDPVEHLRISGRWTTPQAGDTLPLPSGQVRTWRALLAQTNGTFARGALGSGHTIFNVVADSPGIMILEASGHSLAYVNGEPQPGDVYSYGYVKVPVALHQGTNEFIFVGGRGSLSAKLAPAPGPLFFNLADTTLPDQVRGEATDSWGAVILVNASTQWVTGREMIAELAGTSTRTALPTIPPLATRKVGFQIKSRTINSSSNSVPLQLSVVPAGKGIKAALAKDKTELRLRQANQAQKKTFISDIDGSVQYYGLHPQNGPNAPGEKPALFLSLHGASVEGIGQAEAYGPKRWGVIVSPTNRRPYGFDWEDWGRMDALEVLDLATQRYHPDPSKVYLTGHSMGGHGTWNFGANFANRFAAIAPSAGWISFWSYGGSVDATNNEPMRAMLRRASAPS
ncbi:MAG TPA: hypothetical protein VMF06_20740, partial [Candidatus Limnocylindria bacterium]|nr:hypothetical protein [Candidatus Limnocylindria bacterium]